MGFKCIWCGETDKRKEHSCKICDEQIALGVLNPKTDMICEECENKTFTELDRTLKNLYSGYENLGITDPNLIPLMQQDIQQNEEEGTPLSLPKTAYSMTG